MIKFGCKTIDAIWSDYSHSKMPIYNSLSIFLIGIYDAILQSLQITKIYIQLFFVFKMFAIKSIL